MKIGTSHPKPLLGPDYLVPRHRKNEIGQGQSQQGLLFKSTHFISAGNDAELERLNLPPSRQANVLGHVFGAGASDNADARKQVRTAHASLIGTLAKRGGLPACPRPSRPALR